MYLHPSLPVVVLRETPLDERYEKCAWCWDQRHPGMPYPEQYSSTMCPPCDEQIRAQARAGRLQRQKKNEVRPC